MWKGGGSSLGVQTLWMAPPSWMSSPTCPSVTACPTPQPRNGCVLGSSGRLHASMHVLICKPVPSVVVALQVSDACEHDPLAIPRVVIPPDVQLQLEQCWAGQGAGAALRRQLFPDVEAWLALVQQALSRDIRSVHQRLHGRETPRGAGAEARAHEQDCMHEGRAGAAPGGYQVVLQGVKVLYDISTSGAVHLHGAHVS